MAWQLEAEEYQSSSLLHAYQEVPRYHMNQALVSKVPMGKTGEDNVLYLRPLLAGLGS